MRVSVLELLIEGMLCVRQSDIYLCNNSPVLVTQDCGGKCVDGRELVDGKCVLPQNTWKCDGKIQSVSTPCYGLCKNSSDFDRTDQPDYVLCGEKCLHRIEAWDCNGQCQHFSEPCNGECKSTSYMTYRNSECKLTSNPLFDCSTQDLKIVSNGAWKPVTVSAISGISIRRVTSALPTSPCPRLFCRVNQKCCLLIEDAHHNIRCPSNC